MYIIVVNLQADTIITSSAPAMEELVVVYWIDSHYASFNSANGKRLHLRFLYCPLAHFQANTLCRKS